MADFRLDTRNFLNSLSKEELITRLMALQKHLFSMRENGPDSNMDKISQLRHLKKQKYQKPIIWSEQKFIKVALKFAYLGADFNGLQIQTATANTVESHIWRAILVSKLRPDENMPGEFYSRCARTDKGVSAFQNVLTIELRSKGSNGENGPDKENEYDYVTMLNAILPNDIRILSWAKIDENFDSRHNCIYRTYQYIFPVTKDLDLSNMESACQKLIGCHDYRNFCKINLSTAKTHVRRILEARIITGENENSSQNTAILEISSTGFLYHQIRLTMTILLQIGLGNENIDVIDELLDIEKNPRRPQYHMANDLPLILTECKFEAFSKAKVLEDDVDKEKPHHALNKQDLLSKNYKLNWKISSHAKELLTKSLRKNWFEKAMLFNQVEILLKIADIDIFDKEIFKLISKDFHVKKHVRGTLIIDHRSWAIVCT